MENGPTQVPPAQRSASVTLRKGEAERQGALMDPAHQSLADALKITMRIVQLAMLGLAVFFLFSGAQQVNEGETGVRLVFGDVVAEDLEPGFTFSWPFPIGELYKIPTGAVTLRLDTEFWLRLDERERQLSITDIFRQNRITPGTDNYAITRDQSLVHMRWRINYQRSSASDYIRSIRSESEQRIIRSLAKRAIVREVATTDIDDILVSGGGAAGLSRRVRVTLQSFLDDLDAGILVESVELDDRTPPPYARSAFDKVQTEAAQSRRKIEEASGNARSQLTRVAGPLADEILEQIDEYTLLSDLLLSAQDAGDTEGAAEHASARGEVLERISDLLLDQRLSGQASTIITEARTYRRTIVSQRETQYETYLARTGQYERNLSVAMHRDWMEAFVQFLADESIEFFSTTGNEKELRLAISRDLERVRERTRELKRREAERVERERFDQFDEERYRVDTSVRAGSAQ